MSLAAAEYRCRKQVVGLEGLGGGGLRLRDFPLALLEDSGENLAEMCGGWGRGSRGLDVRLAGRHDQLC